MLSEFLLRCAPQNASVVQSILAGSLCVFAFLHASGSAASAATIPRPPEQPGDRSSTPGANAEPSPCQLRLGEIAVFRPSPPITGPGECTASDVVAVDAVLLGIPVIASKASDAPLPRTRPERSTRGAESNDKALIIGDAMRAPTLRVPLDGSTAALERLETCFEKNSGQGSETNPFVAPSRKP